MRDLSQAVHRAGCDHHSDGGKASRRDRCADISVGISMVRHATELMNAQVGLVSQSPFAGLGDHQMGLELESTRHLQQPDAIDNSGRATDPYDEPWRCMTA